MKIAAAIIGFVSLTRDCIIFVSEVSEETMF